MTAVTFHTAQVGESEKYLTLLEKYMTMTRSNINQELY